MMETEPITSNVIMEHEACEFEITNTRYKSVATDITVHKSN